MKKVIERDLSIIARSSKRQRVLDDAKESNDLIAVTDQAAQQIHVLDPEED